MKHLVMFAAERDRTHIAVDDATSTYELINVCLNQPVEGGFSFEQIAQRLAIRQAAAAVKSGGDLLLEDSQAALLQSLVRTQRWSGVFDLVPPFVKAVLEMPTVDVQVSH